jgi:hypothetical protein
VPRRAALPPQAAVRRRGVAVQTSPANDGSAGTDGKRAAREERDARVVAIL